MTDAPHFVLAYGDWCTLNPYNPHCSNHKPVLAHSFFPNPGHCNKAFLNQWYFEYIGQEPFWNGVMTHEFGHILGFRHDQAEPDYAQAYRLTPFAEPYSIMGYNSYAYITPTDISNAHPYYCLTDAQVSAIGTRVVSIAPQPYDRSACDYGD